MTLLLALLFVLALLGGFFLRYNPIRPLEGPVRVVDGDSLETPHTRLRLYGIDAPELTQDGGQAAKSQLRTLMAGKTLTVRRQGRDVYGRQLVTLFGDGEDLCAEMVRSGYALHNARSGFYAREERKARKNGYGLWSRGGITSPRQHRDQS
jgi:endonuclease YncB( thermonuclease family)